MFVAEGRGGSSDEAVLQLACEENRLVLTHDSDYGDLLFGRTDLSAPGVVFLRLPARDQDHRWPRLKTVIDSMGTELFGRFVVISRSRTRWRKLEPPR